LCYVLQLKADYSEQKITTRTKVISFGKKQNHCCKYTQFSVSIRQVAA